MTESLQPRDLTALIRRVFVPQPDERSIAIAVVVESGGDFGESATGGSVAAPVAQQVLAEFFNVTLE